MTITTAPAPARKATEGPTWDAAMLRGELIGDGFRAYVIGNFVRVSVPVPGHNITILVDMRRLPNGSLIGSVFPGHRRSVATEPVVKHLYANLPARVFADWLALSVLVGNA